MLVPDAQRGARRASSSDARRQAGPGWPTQPAPKCQRAGGARRVNLAGFQARSTGEGVGFALRPSSEALMLCWPPT